MTSVGTFVGPIEILMVEDNPGDVRLTQEALNDGKVLNELNVVGDGLEAMMYLRGEGEYAGRARPDLILLDLNLPKKSGLEVLEEIKGDQQLRGIPVVILTTSDAEQDVLRTYDLHANCYITKPVDLDQFVVVAEAIEGFWLSLRQASSELIACHGYCSRQSSAGRGQSGRRRSLQGNVGAVRRRALFDFTHVDRLGDGLKLLRDQQFDVALLDLGLPDSHGLDTLTRARKEAKDLP